MRRSVLVAIAGFMMVAMPGRSWQWPVPDPEVTGTFGQDAGGYFLRGVEFGGSARAVFPVEAGRVVAVHSERSGSPTGLGSFVVVEHAQAFRSIYAHLDAESLPVVGQVVGPATQIGTFGESRRAPGESLRLYVIDTRSGEYVNPMLLLPGLPDTIRPTIATVYARSGDSVRDLRQSAVLPPATYEISVEVFDRLVPGAQSPAVMPYSIRMFVGGQETFHAVMERIVVDADGVRVLPAAIVHDTIYDPDGLIVLGSLSIGVRPVQIEIVAEDSSGNESTWRATLSAADAEDP